MPALVVIDTSALFMPFERRISIEAELERLLGPFQGFVPEPCLAELARIASEEKGARRDRAKMALSYSTRFQTVPGEPPADTAALRIA
jgi:rRNA-processing protein FCF1